tara:strand:- start:518 stop:805 length:288 start_codon:yes stop_codon:yes gene_type:complete
MIKKEIISSISEKSKIKNEVVAYVVENFMMEIKNSLIKGENVYLRGFGSFIVKERAEKKARIIKNNQAITVPAYKIPAFKVCKSLKNAVSIKNPC